MPGLKPGVMLSGATTTNSTPVTNGVCGPCQKGFRTFHAVLLGTGSVSASISIMASNEPGGLAANPVTLGTLAPSGTAAGSDGFVSEAPWLYYWAKVTAISGTGATVSVYTAEEM